MYCPECGKQIQNGSVYFCSCYRYNITRFNFLYYYNLDKE